MFKLNKFTGKIIGFYLLAFIVTGSFICNADSAFSFLFDDKSMILKNNCLKVKLNARKAFCINYLAPLKSKDNFLERATVSYLANGEWKAEKGNLPKEEVFKKDQFKIKYSRESLNIEVFTQSDEFYLTKTMTLKKDKPYLGLSYALDAKYSFWMGGGDPPAGVSIPLTKFPKKFDSFAFMENGRLKIEKYKDLRKSKKYGIFVNLNWYARCTSDGKSGVIIILDRSPWKNLSQDGFLGFWGIFHPYAVMKGFKKGDKIFSKIYIAPYSGNPQKIAGRIMTEIFGSEVGIPAKSKYEQISTAHALSGYLLKKLPNTDIWLAGAEKIYPETPVPSKKLDCIQISAAKGESESFQITIRPNMKVTGISPSATELSNSQGEHIPATVFDFNWVDYVPIKYPSNYYGLTGRTPDILQNIFPAQAKSSENFSLWITVNVPFKAKSGEYSGKIILKSDQLGEFAFPLRLKVRNFSLPKTPRYRTAFLIWGDSFSKKNGSPKLRVNEYVKHLQKNRATGIKNISVPFDGKDIRKKYFLAEIDKRLKKKHATCFSISGVMEWRKFRNETPLSNKFNKKVLAFTKATCDAMRDHGCLDKVWWLMSDETHNRDKYLKHLKYIDLVRAVAPDLPLFATINLPSPELAARADILCSPLSVFLAQFFNNRKYLGKEFWFYENGLYFCTDMPTTIPRSLTWLSYKYGVKGYHQWSTIRWNDYFTPDCWNGQGYLYYPLDKGDPLKPKGSIRLAMFREGEEDYEYLKLLNDKINELKKIDDSRFVADIKEAEKCLDNCVEKIVKDKYEFTRNIMMFYSVREKLATQIEKLQKRCKDYGKSQVR